MDFFKAINIFVNFAYNVANKYNHKEAAMLLSLPYDRRRAVEYARRWALSRNPLFPNFAGLGGDCTNFISQCIFAGAPVMNYTPTFGWYYISPEDRAPAWSGVDELYSFLTGAPSFASQNKGYGPFATDVRDSRELRLGDVIQLANGNGEFYHTLIISDFTENDILVCAHTNDALDRPLSSYNYTSIRALHIGGAMVYLDDEKIFSDLIEGISLPLPDIV